MKTLLIILVVIVLLAAVGYVGLTRTEMGQSLLRRGAATPASGAAQEGDTKPTDAPTSDVPTETPASPAEPAVQAGKQVVADAKVVPIQSANLSMPTGGIAAEVLVAEGDQVQAGQTLIRLEAARQRAAVAQAEASLQSSQARLADLKAGSRTEEIAAAQAALEAAQASLKKVQEGADEAQIIAARADVANAEAALRQAQAAYDKVKWNADIGARPESAQLEQATNSFTAAQSRLNDLLKGATQADIDAAQARVRQAQAQLELTQAGARPESVAASEADVAVTSAALEQAMVALNEMELKAPFAGTIAALDVKVGEPVAPAAPVVRLADLSAWRIETDDLTELNIVNVQEGDAVKITLDAIPGLELPGHVERIKSIGENKQGDITYTVVIALDQTDPRLRWNMTASVTIEPK